MRRKVPFAIVGLGVLVSACLMVRTGESLLPIPDRLTPGVHDLKKVQVLDRNGTPLSVTYQNRLNFHDFSPLHAMPPLLVDAFLESEDRRFFRHNGVDWVARIHAAVQNALALRVVRGASTISEQVIRMLHPRPRTIWSRWIEGVEAQRLERRFSKAEILEFYLNQVPYAHQRRGVNQAARFYFDRDSDSLSVAEVLALAVLVRAPGRMALRKQGGELERGVVNLASRMKARGLLSEEEYRSALEFKWSPAAPALPVEAGHFVQTICGADFSGNQNRGAQVVTTLDGALQGRVQKMLDTRLRDLSTVGALDGAVLVVDHLKDEVLAWVNGGGLSSALPGGWIDAVLAPRQPGSTLKPFLYALALESGWTAATLIEDAPLVEPVGTGLHSFRNYSRTHYGLLRLREALGNSLNVPAVHAIQFTGQGRFLETLHQLGFDSLNRPAEHYGDGLALGDGEVSLLELVQAYAVLGRQGEWRPLRVVLDDAGHRHPARRIFQEETAALIGDILSDPQARRLEFGDGHLLRFPVQTAVKTGTSSDHRDAWAMGYSHRYTVGVWMGNLERKPTRGITGARGPGLVLRGVFAELNRSGNSRPLSSSSRLIPVMICRESGLLAGPCCPAIREHFKRETVPTSQCMLHGVVSTQEGASRSSRAEKEAEIAMLQPTRDLQLRMDPHIPDELEAFPFLLPQDPATQKVEWTVDGVIVGQTGPGEHRFVWKLVRGAHLAHARIWKASSYGPEETPVVPFVVK